MNDRRVVQKGICAGGHVAGGDITVIHEVPRSPLQALVADLHTKLQDQPGAVAFVDRLMKFMEPDNTAISRDLEKKLADCGRGYLYKDALRLKESFRKQLTKTTFNPAIQEVYAHILGEVWAVFTHEIKPTISTDATPGGTERAISSLAHSITMQLAEAPPELGIGKPEVLGMLYYLTGNCFLEWDYA